MLLFRAAFVCAAFSVLGFAQVTVTPGGFATSSGPAVPEAVPTSPLVVTPSVSLPGHGPAWASSLPTEIGVPTVDPSQPAVWNPALGQFGGTSQNMNLSAVGTNNGQGTPETGTGTRSQARTTPQDVVVPPTSLAEVADKYRHTNTAHGKTYTNEDLASLHSAGETTQSSFRPENANPETSAPATSAQAANPEPNESPTNTMTAEPSNEMGGNASGLPQSDQPIDTYDASGKPNAGRRSVKSEVERELQEMKSHKK